MKPRRVVAFGVFDLLHPGHLRFLAQAKKFGTELVVVVSRDARVLTERGTAPLMNERERLAMVNALAVVDQAVLGDKPGTWRILRKLAPDVVVLGHDQALPTSNEKTTWTYRRVAAYKRERWQGKVLKKLLHTSASPLR